MERWLETLGRRAIYKNREYEFINHHEFSNKVRTDEYWIFSYQEKSDLENGFSGLKPASGRLIKHVPLEDLSFVFEKETTAIYKGDLFGADFIRGKEIMLSTKDRDLAEKHGMEERSGGEYCMRVKLSEAEEITQKWIPLDAYNKQIFAHENA